MSTEGTAAENTEREGSVTSVWSTHLHMGENMRSDIFHAQGVKYFTERSRATLVMIGLGRRRGGIVTRLGPLAGRVTCPARVHYLPSPGSSLGSPASTTTGADSPPCWLCDRRHSNSTSDGADCAHRLGTTRHNSSASGVFPASSLHSPGADHELPTPLIHALRAQTSRR